MGCGESKHDVATGNTISKKKSNAGEQSKESKDTKTVLEKETDSLLVQEQEGNQNVKTNEVTGDQPAAEDVKDIEENTEPKAENTGPKEEDNNKEKPAERFISKESPNRYFSSRKEEESVEGIVSEGKSEKSEYDSPRPEAEKESLFNDVENIEKVDNAVEEETMPAETENAAGVSVKNEENLVKETEKEPLTTVEGGVSAAANAEKNLDNPEKEHSVASQDLKAV